MKFILLSILLSLNVHASPVGDAVSVTTLRLNDYRGVFPEPLGISITDIQHHFIVCRPSIALAKITNEALLHSSRVEEAKQLIFKHANFIPENALAMLKGQSVDVVMFTSKHIMAITKHNQLLEAVKSSLHLIGAWRNMTTRERSGLRHHI